MNTWQSAWYHHVQQKQYCSGTGPYAVRAKVQNLIADKNQNLEHEWKHIPRYWPFVRGIHRLQVDFPQKDIDAGGYFIFILTCITKRLSK